MGRSIALPGILGDLARSYPGGLNACAGDLRISARTLRQWAHNERAPGGIEAARIREACEARGIAPLLYEIPGFTNIFVGSTPEGWVQFTPGTWKWRVRYVGDVAALVTPPGPWVATAARKPGGWPWPLASTAVTTT